MASLSADVVVVGGGVIGAATTYYLAKDGVAVLLLERGGLASGTSSACEGSILMQTKRPGLHLECARQSNEMYAGLSEELDCDLEYSQHGSMVIAETELELEAITGLADRQCRVGLDVELLDQQATRVRQPSLGDHVLGASFCPIDGEVNPYRVALAFAAAARRKGARIFPYTSVRGIRRGGSQVVGVETGSNIIATTTVVNAAGVWAPNLGQMVEMTIPITPRRGMILLTEAREPTVRGMIVSAEYLTSKLHHVGRSDDAGTKQPMTGGLVVGQAKSGNILIGSSRDSAGHDARVTHAGIVLIASRAVRALPLLRGVAVIRTYAGLRPATPDGLPILGAIPGLDGFVMAAGHEGDGIALAPWTGRSIADLILGRRVPEQFDRLNLQRFDEKPGS